MTKLAKKTHGWLLKWILLIPVVTCGIAQTGTPHPKPARSTVKGRVFAITEGGDLKPARMADVYIFALLGLGDTAGHIYYQESVKAANAYSADLVANGAHWSKKLTCMNELDEFEPVVLKVLNWADANKKVSQITMLKTDEDGYFTTTLKPGDYTIAVRGRAGFNEALWVTMPLSDISVVAGHNLDLKFSSPSVSCVD